MLFELPYFEHIDAKDVNEAVGCLCEYCGRGRVIARGTDLLSLMKDRIEGPEFKPPEILVNIKTIPGIGWITPKETGECENGNCCHTARSPGPGLFR
jgi:CO/xanthine dehydrogenase FAD-binding subunit